MPGDKSRVADHPPHLAILVKARCQGSLQGIQTCLHLQPGMSDWESLSIMQKGACRGGEGVWPRKQDCRTALQRVLPNNCDS